MIEVWSKAMGAWLLLETGVDDVEEALAAWRYLLPTKLLRARPPGNGDAAELLDDHC